MKNVGWTVSIWLVLVMIGFSCGSSSAPAPVKGCTVVFKGKAVNLPNITCDEFKPGEFSVASTNEPLEQEVNLVKSDTLQTIVFFVSLDPGSRYSSTFSNSPSTVTISGKTWTFNGVVENGSGDSGSISGTCNCPN